MISMPRRSLSVALSSALTLGLVCGCGSSQHRTQGTDGPCCNVALPPAPVLLTPDIQEAPDAPADHTLDHPPLEAYHGHESAPPSRDVDLRHTSPTSDTPRTGPAGNPFETSAPLNGNPFETHTSDPAPWDRGPAGHDTVETQPVEAPQPEVTDVVRDEVLQRLGATVERDAQGRPVLIDLSNTAVQNADLAMLEGMSQLGQLDLSSTAVTDEGLRYLSGLSKLQLLALSGTKVSDAGLAQLESLELRFLLLGFTSISDAGVDALGRMDKLEGLSLRGSRLTADGVARLKKLLPNCRIVADAPQVSAPANRSQTPAPASPARSPDRDQTVPVEVAPETDGPTLGETDIRRELISGLPAGTTLQPGAATLSEAEIQLVRISIGNLGDAATYDAIGEYFALTGRRSAAIAWLRAAVDAAPEERLYRYHLAVALARSGRLQAALPHFTHAVGQAAAQYNLGVIAWHNGDVATSRRHFAEALRQNPQLAAASFWVNRIDLDLAARTASRRTTIR